MRFLRNEQNRSLAQLAEDASLTKGHLSTIEAGRCAITIETAWRLAASLQVPVSYLFVFPEQSEYDALAELIRKISPARLTTVMRIVQTYV